jgi:hypothetical protein
MLDLSAPILPGQGAAGLQLGSPVAPLETAGAVRRLTPAELAFRLPPDMARYRAPAVDLWAEDGRLTQIAVGDPYRGLLRGRIGLGATVAELEAAFGPCALVDLSLSVRGLRGVSFDAEGPGEAAGPALRARRLTRIYVFVPEDG